MPPCKVNISDHPTNSEAHFPELNAITDPVAPTFQTLVCTVW